MSRLSQFQYKDPSAILDALITNLDADGANVDYNLIRNEYHDLNHLIKKSASLVIAGGAYKQGTVYGFNPQTSALIPFTFTRTGTATRVNSAGLIETVAANVPRMDFDPITGKFKGLLMERGSTNLMLNSEDLTNVTWNKARVDVAPNVTTAPDGNLTAEKLTATLGMINDHAVYYASGTRTVGGTYTISIHVKAAEFSRLRLYMATNSFSNSVEAKFNLTTQTYVITNVSANPWISPTALITPMPNGWFRVSFTATGNATDSTLAAAFYLVDNTNGNGWTGDGTSGVYLWGAQLETGQLTSYIPTAGATVTRGVEFCSANVGAWFTASEGALYTNTTHLTAQAGTPYRIMCFDNGTGTDRIQNLISSASPKAAELLVSTASVNQVTLESTSIVNGVPSKIASAYKVNDFAMVHNGGTILTDTAGTIPTGIFTLIIGSALGSAAPIDGQLKTAAYFPTRLANTELQAITA